MGEFQLIDQYVRALHQNPTAVPPPGLDLDMADFIRKIVLARRTAPQPDVQARVWQRVQANVQPDHLNRNDGRHEEKNLMQTTFTRPTIFPRAPTRIVQPRFIRLAVALITVVLFAAILLPGMVREPSPGGPSTVYLSAAVNQATFERYINEAWNGGNTGILSDILAADHVCHEPGMMDVEGVDGMAAHIATYRTAFPDWQFVVESITTTDDGVWARLIGTGTHDGPFALPDDVVIEATGNVVSVEVLINARFMDGKITEQWMQLDALGLMQQLGVAASVDELVAETQNLEIARRVIDDLWNGANLDSAEDLYASDYSSWFPAHTNMRVSRNPRGWQAMYIALHRTFPDLQVTVRGMVADGDTVVVHYEAQGTLENSYSTAAGKPIPATGEMITWDGVFLYRIEDGKIIEEWWYWDNEEAGVIDYRR